MKSRFKTFDGVYVIAEIGINHNGRLDEAKELIRASVEGGADAVKFQVRDLASVYTRAVLGDPLKAEQGSQYLISELKRAHLTHDDIRELQTFARQFAVDFFATPFDPKSAHFLNDLGMDLFKVGSPDFTNLPLLDLLASFGKPIILSTGMTEEAEILQVVDFLKRRNADFALLHCNSNYPAALPDINVRYVPRLAEITGVRTGYSGHEEGYAATLAAVALGATIIERHITFDRAAKGPDHRASLLPEDFKEMVRQVRDVATSLGEPRRTMNQGELNNRLGLAKSLVAARNLPEGTVLAMADLTAKSPAKGLSPIRIEEYLGKPLLKELKEDDYLTAEHLRAAENTSPRAYRIPKKWGLVGRMNDFEEFLALKPELIEIHMTWRDIVNYRSPASTYTQELVVHAPEYYQDNLIDFTSPDPNITEMSLEMLRKTIACARDLAPRFKGMRDTKGPRVVVHPGGHFTQPRDSNKTDQYRLLMKNLKSVDSEGVQLLVENMPPFPWYFGGRWYNTVFMDAGEIAQFAQEMKWGVCYDTSHAQLFCKKAGITLADFTRKLLPHVAYLHISDAKGTGEEGLQIGKGEIDFPQLFALLGHLNTGFIPEIWQGHLNRGEGFKDALVKIEALMAKSSGASCDVESHGPGPHTH